MTQQDKTIPEGLSLRCTLTGHTDSIHRIVWSPAGDVLVSPSRDRSTRFWKDGKLLDMLKDKAGRSIAAAWSPDGKRIALVADNDILRLWNIEAGASERTRSGGLGHVTSVAWSPNNNVVATGTLKTGVRLWDPEFKSFRALGKKGAEPVYCVAFSKKGSYLAAGMSSGLIRVWNLDDGKEPENLEGHSDSVYSLVFSATSGLLASGSADGTIRLWDPVESREECVLQGHAGAVHSVSISSHGRLLASKSADETVRLWSLEIEEPIAVLAEPLGKTWLPGIAFHPLEPILATLGQDDLVIRLWDLDFAKLLGEPSY